MQNIEKFIGSIREDNDLPLSTFEDAVVLAL